MRFTASRTPALKAAERTSMLSTPGALEGAAVVSARIEEVRLKKKTAMG